MKLYIFYFFPSLFFSFSDRYFHSFVILMGNTGSQLWAPDRSGYCRVSTGSSKSQWAAPGLNGELQIAVGSAGRQREVPGRSGQCQALTENSRAE